MKIKKQKYLFSKVLVLILITVLLIAVVCLSVVVWSDDRTINKNLSLISIRQLGGAFDGSQPIVDASHKRLYLPGLNLYFPLTIDSTDLMYRVTDKNGGGTTDLVFSTNTFNSSVSVDSDQNDICSYLVRVEIGATEAKPRPSEVSQNPFRLNDGRLVYSYLPESSSKCGAFQFTLAQQIEPIIRQLQSY